MTPIRAFLIIAALFAAFMMSGWRTVSDAQRDEDTKWRLKHMDLDAMKLEDRVSDLDRRVKALEARP